VVIRGSFKRSICRLAEWTDPTTEVVPLLRVSAVDFCKHLRSMSKQWRLTSKRFNDWSVPLRTRSHCVFSFCNGLLQSWHGPYVFHGNGYEHVRIAKTMELLGYPKVRPWVETTDSNDMELTVAVAKRDPDNKVYPGGGPFPISAAGLLRVSHRALDKNRSAELEPYHLHLKEDLLKPGEIVPVDIGLWPLGLRYHPGETLILSTAATNIDPIPARNRWETSVIEILADGGTFMPNETVPMVKIGGLEPAPKFVKEQQVKEPLSRNKGSHIIHFGGKYDSHVLMPVRYV
jgi:hypothetical protein